MQINSTKTSFTSRNSVIRRADDLARRVNTAFPRVSQSHVFGFKNINKFQYLEFNLRERTRQLRSLKSSRFDNGSKTIDKLLAFITPVEERKYGNCAESAQIAAICAKLNGIEDAQIMLLKTRGGRSLDHAVLYVQNGNQPYIIDPWIGKAGYADEMLERYSSEYRENFDMGKYLKTKDINFIPNQNDVYSRFLKKDLSEDDRKRLLELYPQLLIG